ncbi:hypothetical protein K438DRAFT_1995629 [Mycena galopus ATCC 62051]|nr:hypothetical protein K438DRAFT_1995629 [Mycena galopus ATCC 62051]
MFFQTATHGRSRSFTLTSILVAADLASAMSAHVFLYILISHRGLVHTRVSQQGPQHAPRQSRATLTPYFLSRISYAPHRPSTPSTPNALERGKKHAPSPAVPLPTCRPDSGARGLRHDSETATCALWRARSAPRLGSCYTRALACASLYGVRTDDAVPPRRLFHPRSTTYTTERDATALDRARRLHYLPTCQSIYLE